MTPASLLNASSSLESNFRQVRLKVPELDSEFCTQTQLFCPSLLMLLVEEELAHETSVPLLHLEKAFYMLHF